jgi:hypothetical protein
MSKALEHSPIRYSKTVLLLGIVAALRYGLLKGKQIVLVALFGTTSGRVLRFLVHHARFNFGTAPPGPAAIFTVLAVALRRAAFNVMARARNPGVPLPNYPVLNKEGLQESFPMAGICGRC